MQKIVSFRVPKKEIPIISSIADRACKLANRYGGEYSKSDAHMDITACHANGNPLDLKKLLRAPDGDFGHDVFGIRRFIDRTTGELTNCFVPRCSLRQTQPMSKPEKFDLKKLESQCAEDKSRCDLLHFKEALQILKDGRDFKGNSYSDMGKFNQACWIGENCRKLIKEIESLRAERWKLKEQLS